MQYSELKQRIFNDLFDGLALLALISKEEIEEVAKALEGKEVSSREYEPIFAAVAVAVRMAKEI